jgi:molybdopterin synthase catalytic subunit
MASEHNDGPSRFSVGHLFTDRGPYHLPVHPPATGEDWVGLSTAALPSDAALQWAVTPGCGAAVLFIGTVRDHADGRPGVVELEYEAYVEQAEVRMAAVAAEARGRFPGLGRVALLHRTGSLDVTETAVVVVASAPHRGEAFDGARFCIDTLKATVPIWKKETWAGGEDWGTDATPLTEVRS